MNNLGVAKTLKELQEKINLAIELLGEDAGWFGWDDGSIIMESKKGKAAIDSNIYEKIQS